MSSTQQMIVAIVVAIALLSGLGGVLVACDQSSKREDALRLECIKAGGSVVPMDPSRGHTCISPKNGRTTP